VDLPYLSKNERPTVVVTTANGKLIRVLEYDPNADKLSKPSTPGSKPRGSRLDTVIKESADKIVRAINKPDPSQSSKTPPTPKK
jgi:hypothetical protein